MTAPSTQLAVLQILATATRRDVTIRDVLRALIASGGWSGAAFWAERIRMPTLIAHEGDIDVEHRIRDARLPPVSLTSPLGWTCLDGDPPLCTLVCVPVRTSDAVVEVVELYDANRRPAEDALLDVLGALGRTLGATLARIDVARAHEEARLAAEQTLAVKTAFLATMSHEIRTPLHGVMGLLSMLLDAPLEEQHRQYAATAHRAGASLLTLLNDVLDLSKIEAGRLEVERIAFTPSQVVDEVVSVFHHVAQEKQLALEVRVAPAATETVLGDPARLRQILFNLVGNAVKFTASGGVTITVDRAIPGRLRVRVSDTGIGIADKALPHLFQTYSQSDASMPRRFGGSGLGLAIAQHLATLLGGTITVESKLGVGSSFELDVPASAAATSSRPSLTSPETPLPKLRVIVVDDQRVNLLIATGMLQRLGQTVTTVSSGQEALELLKTEEFDLVLMDCLMPGLDGYDTTRALRAIGFTRPIVAFTARERQFEANAFREAGMDDIITKPATQRDIANVIRRHSQPT